VRPYALLSCAVSLDGYLDDATPDRLILSNDADLDRVDEVRASCDAILVGAGTVRADNPRLLVRSARRRAERVARGLPESPVKVVLTGRGGLDPEAAFFTAGDGTKLVYAAPGAAVDHLRAVATVVESDGLPSVVADLHARGVRRLMVEGGATVHTAFMAAGLADELHLAVAPLFVGDPAAPRFAGPRGGRARLVEARTIGEVVLLRYRFNG